MSVSTSTQKDLQDRLIEMSRAGREGFDEFFKNAKLGQIDPNDQQFLLWWQLHTTPVRADGSPNQFYDPDFVRALPYVDGGKQLMARYVRLTSPQPDAVDRIIAQATGTAPVPSQAPVAALTPPAGPPPAVKPGDAWYRPDPVAGAITGVMGNG